MMNEEEALKQIEQIKNDDYTKYFSGEISARDIFKMCRNGGFSCMETELILSTLVACGCKFRD